MEVKKVWGLCDNGSIEIISLPPHLVEETLVFLRKTFLKDEYICRTLNLTQNSKSCEEAEMVFHSFFKDGVSLVAVDTSSKEVIGAAVNKLCTVQSAKHFYEKYRDKCTTYNGRALYQILVDCSQLVDPFQKYDVDCVLDLGFLGVDMNYRGKKIGQKLVEFTIDLCRSLLKGNNVKNPIDSTIQIPLEPVAKVVTGVMTSLITQKISKNLNFDLLEAKSFDEFYFEGKRLSSILENKQTKGLWVTAKRL